MNRLRNFLIAVFAILILTTSGHAEHLPGWGQWWLPPVHSEHGPAIDTLFVWIFWITTITFFAVEGLLVIFLIKYRSRPEKKKAYFTHGNTRLEMAWTIAPAIILAALALSSKKVWDDYRYSPSNDDPSRAKILVVGQQFKWNFVYPGPDGKLGRYLIFPRPTDAFWPVGEDGKPFFLNYGSYQHTKGPADMPYDDAVRAINQYIDQENPLGKDFADPDGKDDNYDKTPGRSLVLPAHRPIEIQLSSKDVIHDFFLPNFRVKLDAVPGMRGHISFTATETSAERAAESAKIVPLDQLSALLDQPAWKDATVIIDENSPGDEKNKNKDRTGWRYINPASPRSSIIRAGQGFNADPTTRAGQIDKLKAAGLTEIRMTTDNGNWELVCEELCGQGHNTMTAVVTIVSSDEYDKRGFDTPYKPATATAAVNATAMNVSK